MARLAATLSFLIFGLLLTLSSAPGAQDAGGVTYSLRGYNLEIVPDFNAHRLSVDATIDIANPQLLPSFVFGLSSRYSTVIVEADSSRVTAERSGDWITVTLARPTRAIRLRFHLEGAPGISVDENRAVIADSSLFLLWSDRFYPMDFERWAPVRISLILPAGFQAIAPGRLVSSTVESGKTHFVFESLRPTTLFSVFADCRWRTSARVVNGVTMKTLLCPQSERFREQILATSGDVLKFYSDMMCPYPFDGFSFVEIDSIYARRAFPGFIGYSPRYLEKEFTTTGYDAHETALLWWDYTIRGTGPGSFQWTEGFGDYAEVMYAQSIGKPIAQTFQRFREEYLNTPASDDLIYNDLRGNTPQKLIHGKYPWLLHLVRYVTGEKAFRSGLQLLFRRYRDSTFTMDRFVSTLEDGTGQSLKWWREEWLERRGVPDLMVSGKFESSAAGTQLSCTITQRGNVYHLPLEISVTSGGQTQVETVRLSKGVETFKFSSVTPPATVQIDPGGWVLMRPVPVLEIR